MPKFDRGFKSWAERSSLGLRSRLGFSVDDALPIDVVANHLRVKLMVPADVVGLPEDARRQLLHTDSDGWSAVTLSNGAGYLLIYNPAHSVARRSSNVMHELSHIICGHEPSKMILSADGEIVMRSWDQKQEDEAAWLAGALLLPREALVTMRRKGIDLKQICKRYAVSEDIVRYRLNVTGVDHQMKRSGSFRPPRSFQG